MGDGIEVILYISGVEILYRSHDGNADNPELFYVFLAIIPFEILGDRFPNLKKTTENYTV